MSLAARRSTRRREDFVIRLGCLLVSFAVLASLILEPPRAKAEALTLAAVGGVGLLGAYLAACGMTPYATGMDRNGANEALARSVQEFLDDTFGPGSSEPSGGGSNKPSLNDWLGMITFTVSNGVVRFGKEAADKLNQFAQWVASKYGTKAGVNQVYVDSAGLFNFKYDRFLSSGVLQMTFDYPNAIIFNGIYGRGSWGTGGNILVPEGTRLIWCETKQDIYGEFYIVSDVFLNSGRPSPFKETDTEKWYLFEAKSDQENFLQVNFKWVGTKGSTAKGDVLPIESTYTWIKSADAVDAVFGLDVADTLTIPEGLTDSQSVALDVGATDSMSIQEILQGILDAILAGDFAASAEIVDEAVEPVDPPAEELPDVDGLGLPALGAVLTSRFPFSIPWDVYKGVTLLAAPPKAPYFEVDFMAPIADRVGGWQGSTKIVLDFSEYEIIGQVCRWTSTIGFCLMLATGTKRLIWTA